MSGKTCRNLAWSGRGPRLAGAIGLVAGIVQTSTATAAELDVYGKINVTLQNSEERTQQQVELQSNASRVGVKGERELQRGLKVVYQLEWGVDFDGRSGDENVAARNQYVGLQGRFGTLAVGRHDTALKEAQGDFDLFDDLEGDISKSFNGENRLTNYIGYTTPSLAGTLSATVNVFPGEDPASGDDGVADAISLSIDYQTDSTYAALAYDRDVDGEGIDTTRVVGGHTVGPTRLMLLYQRRDDGSTDQDGFGASIAWSFGNCTAKLQYLDADIWRMSPQPDPLDNLLESLLSVGIDYALADSTKVFGFYTTGDVGGTSTSNDYTAIGIEHTFD